MAPARRPAPRGKARLDRERVLDAASDLVARGRLEAFTMRSLARRLDVDVSTLYWHFASRDALLEALFARLAEGVELDVPRSGDWRKRSAAACEHVRALLVAHPELLAAAGHASLLAPFLLRVTHFLSITLLECGFRGRSALLAGRALLTHAFASAQLECRLAKALPAPDRMRDLFGADARADRDPEFAAALRGVGLAYEDVGVEDGFRYGLARLLDGLASDRA